MRRLKGKYTRISWDDPKAVGECGISGFLARREDMIQKPIPAGSQFVNSNVWAIPKFVKKPNPQSLTKLLGPDPLPIYWPLPPIPSFESPYAPSPPTPTPPPVPPGGYPPVSAGTPSRRGVGVRSPERDSALLARFNEIRGIK